jgi:SAM-dependent methyltransferase
MSVYQLVYQAFYFFGFTPWDGHPLPKRLVSLIEGDGQQAPLAPGRALDIGCGTGETSIYLAKHGWQTTGVDFTPKALARARQKATAARADIDFVRADVAKLRDCGLTPSFEFVFDFGLLHATDETTRAAYGPEITVLAAPGATLLLLGFLPGEGGPVRGIDQAGVLQALGPAWTLVAAGEDQRGPLHRQGSLRWYELRRTKTALSGPTTAGLRR